MDEQEDFKDRPKKLIAAFQALDRKKTGKIPTKLLLKLLTMFDDQLSEEEQTELVNEADEGGVVKYEDFVKNVIFGKVK